MEKFVLEDRSFEGVSAAVWERMKATGRDEHGTVFEETGENRGTATTRTPVGMVVLEFQLHPAAERVHLQDRQTPDVGAQQSDLGRYRLDHRALPQRLTTGFDPGWGVTRYLQRHFRERRGIRAPLLVLAVSIAPDRGSSGSRGH